MPFELNTVDVRSEANPLRLKCGWGLVSQGPCPTPRLHHHCLADCTDGTLREGPLLVRLLAGVGAPAVVVLVLAEARERGELLEGRGAEC